MLFKMLGEHMHMLTSLGENTLLSEFSLKGRNICFTVYMSSLQRENLSNLWRFMTPSRSKIGPFRTNGLLLAISSEHKNMVLNTF